MTGLIVVALGIELVLVVITAATLMMLGHVAQQTGRLYRDWVIEDAAKRVVAEEKSPTV